MVHACQPGWHGAPGLAAASSISARVLLASWFQYKQVRCSMKEKCCVGKRQGEDGKESKTFRDRTLRPHNPTTVVMLYLAGCVTARWQPPLAYTLSVHCPHSPHLQLRWRNREEQDHSLPFHPRNCQTSTLPQLAPDPFLPAGLRHTPLCQCLVQMQGGVGMRRESGCSFRFVMNCSKTS